MSIFNIKKNGTQSMVPDKSDPMGIRYKLDTSEEHSAFYVSIDKVYHFRNSPDEPGIDKAAREYILEDLKLQIELELEEIRNGETDRHRRDGTTFDR